VRTSVRCSSARLELLRGDDGAMDRLSALRGEAIRTGQVQSAIEAAILIAFGLVLEGRAQEALDTLAETERGWGGEAELYGSMLARTRAQALAELDRTAEARDAVAIGLSKAREQGLAFEVAQLRLIEAGLIDDPATSQLVRAEAEDLFRELGVVETAPSPRK
jgi:hypothetical protein